MSQDIVYELTSPVSYHHEGENKEATTVILNSPSNKQRRSALRMKQCFFRALHSFKDEQQASGAKQSDEKLKGSDVVALLMMSDVDIDDAHEAFKALITGGCARIDGAVDLSEHHYDNLSMEDMEAMMGEYLVAFLVPSS